MEILAQLVRQVARQVEQGPAVESVRFPVERVERPLVVRPHVYDRPLQHHSTGKLFQGNDGVQEPEQEGNTGNRMNKSKHMSQREQNVQSFGPTYVTSPNCDVARSDNQELHWALNQEHHTFRTPRTNAD